MKLRKAKQKGKYAAFPFASIEDAEALNPFDKSIHESLYEVWHNSFLEESERLSEKYIEKDLEESSLIEW